MGFLLYNTYIVPHFSHATEECIVLLEEFVYIVSVHRRIIHHQLKYEVLFCVLTRCYCYLVIINLQSAVCHLLGWDWVKLRNPVLQTLDTPLLLFG